MNNQERKEQIDEIQKDIVSACFKSCFDLGTLQVHDKCTDHCYKSYMNTIKDVTTSLMEIGYQHHSILAYKAFPKHAPYFDAIYGEKIKEVRSDVAFAYDYVSHQRI